jgi:hypothetical protein
VRLFFFPVGLSFRVARIIGFRRLFLIGVGVGIGMVVAPTSGAELRARLQGLLDERAVGMPQGDLAEQVRYELSHSPRTWHLPQPQVEVVGAIAVLRGEVPHDIGRADLERTAAAVAGIVSVDNHLAISGTNGQQ